MSFSARSIGAVPALDDLARGATVRAWAMPDESEVHHLAAWMWLASRPDLAQASPEADDQAARLWLEVPDWMKGYWLAHARGYLVNRAQRGI